jgi:hypothetical protein
LGGIGGIPLGPGGKGGMPGMPRPRPPGGAVEIFAEVREVACERGGGGDVGGTYVGGRRGIDREERRACLGMAEGCLGKGGQTHVSSYTLVLIYTVIMMRWARTPLFVATPGEET